MPIFVKESNVLTKEKKVNLKLNNIINKEAKVKYKNSGSLHTVYTSFIPQTPVSMIEFSGNVSAHAVLIWDPGDHGVTDYEKQTLDFTYSSNGIYFDFSYLYEYDATVYDFPPPNQNDPQWNPHKYEHTSFSINYTLDPNTYPNFAYGCKCEVYNVLRGTVIATANSYNFNPTTRTISMNFSKSGRFYYEDDEFGVGGQDINEDNWKTVNFTVKVYF